MLRSTEFELPVGTVVEVRERFRGRWSRGFVITESTVEGYLLRRVVRSIGAPDPVHAGRRSSASIIARLTSSTGRLASTVTRSPRRR